VSLPPVLPVVPEPRVPEQPMKRYAAPLGFTLAAVWVMVVFALVSTTH
jgi:hypothetical protein